MARGTPRLSWPTPAVGLLLAVGCVSVGAAVAAAQSSQINIGVRTKVVDGWLHPDAQHSAEGGHSKVFALLTVQEIKADHRLVKPVDEEYLKRLLLQELSANGFRPYTQGQNPDVLLAVSYGRGELRNPYERDVGSVGGHSGMEGGTREGPNNAENLSAANIVGDTQQLFDEVSPSYQAKLAKAGFEKLFIRVAAFEFPKTPNAKPKMLWKTTIVADDPDHQDLNAIASAMLAAGAPLFDKETADKEVDLYKPVPTGRVNVGMPEVVEPKPAPKS